MFKPPIRTWISNATAVLSREHGSATRQAQESRCSRETLYRHPDKLVQRLTNEPAHMVVHLRTEKQRLNESIAGLRREAQHRILLDKDERRRLATTAYAMSVGLRQVEDLLGRRQGRRRETTRERRAWSGANRPRRLDEATALFENAQRLESAWDRAHAAPDLFRHDGRLNDRTWAEAEIAAALAVLTGLDWSKVESVAMSLEDSPCVHARSGGMALFLRLVAVEVANRGFFCPSARTAIRADRFFRLAVLISGGACGLRHIGLFLVLSQRLRERIEA